MSLTPAGYDLFHSTRRKMVTGLCFFLAIGLFAGMMIYVDSYSIHKWNELVIPQPLAISVSGEISKLGFYGNIDKISGVTHTSLLHRTNCLFFSPVMGKNYNLTYNLLAPTYEKDFEHFKSIYAFQAGGPASNSSELAIYKDLANQFHLSVNDTLTIQFYNEYYDSYDSPQNFTVSGVYSFNFTLSAFTGFDYYSANFEYFFGYALGHPDMVNSRFTSFEYFVDVDHSNINPLNADGAVAYLTQITFSIQKLESESSGSTISWSTLIVNFLLSEVYEYVYWLQSMRAAQITHSMATLLVAALLIFLGIRYNMNERKYQNNILLARGATIGEVNSIANREFFVLSIVSTLFAIGFGILLSRFALASTDFMQFNPKYFYAEPLLVTFTTLIYTVILGIVLPMVLVLFYYGFFQRITVDTQRPGHLAKLARIFSFIKWDILLLLLSLLLMAFLLMNQLAARSNPYLASVIPLVPLVLFLSIASLSIKFIRNTTFVMAKSFRRVFGVIPSSVGIRRIGSRASSAGPLIVVMVLAISSAWTFSTYGATFPVTKEVHARFSMGGDMAFMVNQWASGNLTQFYSNLTSHPLVDAAANITLLYLSLSIEGTSYRFVAIDPLEFERVAYDYLGNELNASPMAPVLEKLAANPTGAIITTRASEEFGVSTGDLLKAYYRESRGYEDKISLFIFNIIGVEPALANPALLRTASDDYSSYYYYYYRIQGTNTIWVNKEYIDNANVSMMHTNMFVARTKRHANGTDIALDLLNSGGSAFVDDGNWNTVTQEVSKYTNSPDYRIGRAVDTLAVIGMILIIVGAFVVYAVEGIAIRRREIALLRSIGADRSLVVRTHFVEMFAILLMSSIFILIYGPVLLYFSINMQTVSAYRYPIPIIPVYPVASFLFIFLIFLISISVFIAIIARVSSRINLADSLNASWTEMGPYRGD